MIDEIRWIERKSGKMLPAVIDNKISQKPEIETILQAYDGHVWFDIPIVSEGEK